MHEREQLGNAGRGGGVGGPPTTPTQTDRLRGVVNILDGLNERLAGLIHRLGIDNQNPVAKTRDTPEPIRRDDMVSVITDLQMQCERLHDKARMLDEVA